MVSWRESGNNAKKEVADFPSEAVTTPPVQANTAAPVRAADPVPAPKAVAKESVIAADLSIEGKIEGAGHVRIAGKFKGDLTVEQGAKLTGSVRAEKVTLSGELDGNVEAAKRVDLLASSAMNGDIKADDLTIASGARLRGHVECGWVDGKSTSKSDDSAAA